MKRSFTPFTGKSYALNSPKHQKKNSFSLSHTEYQIFVKPVTGNIKTLRVKASTTISGVKKMLEKI
jgi:hypothetical protein